MVRKQGVSPKLAKQYYFGPYKILAFTGPVTALIETTTKGKPHRERVHVEKLKKYFPRDETPVEVELPYSEGIEDESPVDVVLNELHSHPLAPLQVTHLLQPSEVPLAQDPDLHVISEATERLTRAPTSSAEISHGAQPQSHPPAPPQATNLLQPSELPLAQEPDPQVNSEAEERLTRAPISSAAKSHGAPIFPNLTESADDSPVIIAHDSLRNESATANNFVPKASNASLTVSSEVACPLQESADSNIPSSAIPPTDYQSMASVSSVPSQPPSTSDRPFSLRPRKTIFYKV